MSSLFVLVRSLPRLLPLVSDNLRNAQDPCSDRNNQWRSTNQSSNQSINQSFPTKRQRTSDLVPVFSVRSTRRFLPVDFHERGRTRQVGDVGFDELDGAWRYGKRIIYVNNVLMMIIIIIIITTTIIINLIGHGSTWLFDARSFRLDDHFHKPRDGELGTARLESFLYLSETINNINDNVK